MSVARRLSFKLNKERNSNLIVLYNGHKGGNIYSGSVESQKLSPEKPLVLKWTITRVQPLVNGGVIKTNRVGSVSH